MLLFHEGLPGSGKSYEAMVRRIIPALVAGREVVAYVEGLNFERIAEASGLEVGRVRELLFPLTREQCEGDGVLTHARDNAMMVLDEAQNFWGNRAKLSAAMTKFVTEHRHRGIDLVLMGQDIRDVHALWRRRIELKLCFLKLTALGSAKRYSVTTYRHLGGDKYEKAGLVVSKYDAKYFGTYASHVSADVNTSDYKESRATVLAGPFFKYGLPVMVVAAVWGAWQARKFFDVKESGLLKHPAVAEASGRPVTGPPARQSPAAMVTHAQAASAPPKRVPSLVEKRFADLSGKARIRLAGLMERGTRIQGVIEWVDTGSHVVERLTLDQLRELGVSVLVSTGLVRVAMGEWQDMATMWPLQDQGKAKMSEAELQRMRDEAGGSGAFTAAAVPARGPAQVDRDLPGSMSVARHGG